MSASHKKSSDENGSKAVLPQKIIANMREATGASDEDIKTMLQICNGDANLATERLLENPFSKVVSKKDKRKQKEDEKRRDRDAGKGMDGRQQYSSDRPRNRSDNRTGGKGYSTSKPTGRPSGATRDSNAASGGQAYHSHTNSGFGWDTNNRPNDGWASSAKEAWPKGPDAWSSGGFDATSAPPLSSPATIAAHEPALSSLPVKATPGMKMADLFKGPPVVEAPPPAAPPAAAPEQSYPEPEPVPEEIDEPLVDEEPPALPSVEDDSTYLPVEAPFSEAPPSPVPNAWGTQPTVAPSVPAIPEPIPEPLPPMPTFKHLNPPAPEPVKETLSFPTAVDASASAAESLQLSFGNFSLGGRSATDGLPGFKPSPVQAIPAAAPIPIPSAHTAPAAHPTPAAHSIPSSHTATPAHTSSHNIVGEPVPASAPLSTDLEAYTASSFPYLGQQASSLDKLQATSASYTNQLHLSSPGMQQHFQTLTSSRIAHAVSHSQASPPTNASSAGALGVKFGAGFGADKIEPASSYAHGFGAGFGADVNAQSGYGGAANSTAYGTAASTPAYGAASSAPAYGSAASTPAYGSAASTPAYGSGTSTPAYGTGTVSQAYGAVSSTPAYASATSTPPGAGYGAVASSNQNAGYGAAASSNQNAGYGAAASSNQNAGYGAAVSSTQNAGYGAAASSNQNTGYGATGTSGQNTGYGAPASTNIAPGYRGTTTTTPMSGYGSATANQVSGYGAAVTANPVSGYGANAATNPVSGYGAPTSSNASSGYGATGASDFSHAPETKPAVSAPSHTPSQLSTSAGNVTNPGSVQPLLNAMYQLPAVEAAATAATSQAAAPVVQQPLSQAAYSTAAVPPGMQYPNYYPNFYPPNMYSYATHYSQGGYPQQASTSYPQAAAGYGAAQAALGVGSHRNFSTAATGTGTPSYPSAQSTYDDSSYGASRDRDVAPGYGSTGTPLNAAAAAFPPQQLRGPYFQGTGYMQAQPYAQQYYGQQYNQFPTQQSLGGSSQPGSGLKLS